jgi:hypothetical protein
MAIALSAARRGGRHARSSPIGGVVARSALDVQAVLTPRSIMQDASILPLSETNPRPWMAQASRLVRYGARCLLDKQYRNHVLDVVNRQSQGAAHPALVPADGEGVWGALLREKRVFIAAGCEMTFLAEHLERLGVETCHTFARGRGSDPMTEILTPGSHALTEPWDAYLLSVSQLLRRLVRRLQLEGIGYPQAGGSEQKPGTTLPARRTVTKSWGPQKKVRGRCPCARDSLPRARSSVHGVYRQKCGSIQRTCGQGCRSADVPTSRPPRRATTQPARAGFVTASRSFSHFTRGLESVSIKPK